MHNFSFTFILGVNLLIPRVSCVQKPTNNQAAVALILRHALWGIVPLVLFSLLGGIKWALAAFYGIGTWWLTSFLFARKVFFYQGAQAAKKIVKSFYLAEIYKFLVTISMFLLAILVLKLAFLPLITAYVYCHVLWIFSLLKKGKP